MSNPFAWIATHPWAYPALEAVHVMGIGTLLGSLLVFELRVWGLGAALPLVPLARLALPLAVVGFLLAVASGSLMFASQPGELVGNRAFVLKMALICAAGVNAAWFHARGGPAAIDRIARLQTLLSIGLWLAVIVCGRWIAYL